MWLAGWLVVNKVVFPCNVSSQQSKFKNDMNTCRNLNLITVRSVPISVFFDKWRSSDYVNDPCSTYMWEYFLNFHIFS